MVRTRALAVALLAVPVTSCSSAVGETARDCPAGVIESETAMETTEPVVELAVAQAPRVDMFPAVGGDAFWSMRRVDIELETREPLELVLSEKTDALTGDPLPLGRVEAGGGVVTIVGPTPPGHLLLVRPRDPKAAPGLRTPLRIHARVRAHTGASTCLPVAARLRPAAATCGNGRLERGEACDDANSAPGDGCDRCRLEPPRCVDAVEGIAGLQPWSCTGEPSHCDRIDCAAGEHPACAEQIRLDLSATVVGRTTVEVAAPLQIGGDVSCPSPLAPDDAVCTAAWPVCTPLSVHASTAEGVAFEGWTGACDTTDPTCTISGAPGAISLIARARSDELGMAWVSALPMVADEVHVAAGPGGFVALALATTIPSVTAPEAGGFVHRRATRLLVHGPEGRLRFDRRVGGRAEHVQPRAVAALGDGGVLLVAAFPHDFPILAADAPRGTRKRRGTVPTERVISRLVRFSAAGDAVWVEDLGEDGSAKMAIADAHAWVAVTRPSADAGYDTELVDVDPSGRRRWGTRLPGLRALALTPEGSTVRVAGVGPTGALETTTLDASGRAGDRVRLMDVPIGASVASSEGLIVVAAAASGDQHAEVSVGALDGTGRRLWTRDLAIASACGDPLVDVGRVGAALVLPLCEQDRTPSGFFVAHLERDGSILWSERLGGPRSGAAGIRPWAVAVGEDGHVVVTGTNQRAATLGEGELGDAGVFVVRLEPFRQ